MFESLSDRFERILDPPAGQGAPVRRRRRRGPPRDPHRPARGGRRDRRWSAASSTAVRAALRGHRGLSQSLSPGQQVIKIVNEELVGILGGETLKIRYARRPRRSSCWPACRARARPPPRPSWPAGSSSRAATRCWSGADLQRPAAVEQLRVLGGQAGVTVFSRGHRPGGRGHAPASRRRERLGRDV